jgi:hypothetical protein
MKSIRLIPYIYAGDFPDDVTEEFAQNNISTHYQNDVFSISWHGDTWPALKQWLVSTYGDSIKEHSRFALGAT